MVFEGFRDEEKGIMKLVLRRVLEKDLETLYQYRNAPDIWKWCRQYSPLHWDNHIAWFKNQSKDPKLSMFVIDAMDESLWPIGVVGLTDIDLVNRRAEFSCYVGPGWQALGVAQAALRCLFNHGFHDLGLNRIWGEVFDENPAFHIFTKKLGMEFEGTRKEFYYRDGRYINCHLISIDSRGFELHSASEAQSVSDNAPICRLG